jgi:hypothetical protein
MSYDIYRKIIEFKIEERKSFKEETLTHAWKGPGRRNVRENIKGRKQAVTIA